MKDYLFKITTRRWLVVSMLGCMMITLCMSLFSAKTIGSTAPEILFLMCVFALLTGWKTIYIAHWGICVRHPLRLWKRTITAERISYIALIWKNEEEYRLLITIDDCQSLKNDKTKDPDLYMLKHLRKVISIQCNKEDAIACKQHFDAMNIPTDIIRKTSYHQRLR